MSGVATILNNSIRYARRDKPASTEFASSMGFSITSTNKSYPFRAFHPSGDIIANKVGSTGGRTLSRSADDGRTWTDLGQPNTIYSANFIWFSSAGTWFAYTNGKKLARSVDGITWADVLDLTTTSANGSMLGQSFTQTSDGTLWAAQYGGGTVYKSINDGVTWTVAYTFTSSDAGDAGTPTVRHIHGIQALPSGLWLMSGDNNTQCGLWKWNGSSAFVRQSSAITDPDAQKWRTVGLVERGGFLYWIQDAANQRRASVFRADPTDLAGTLTELASDLPTAGWYAVKTSDGTIVLGGINEQTGESYNLEQDRAIRLWAIDASDNVHEILTTRRGTFADNVLPYSSFSPLAIRASDNLLGASVNQTDWHSAGTASLYGRIVVGGNRSVITRERTPENYTDIQRRIWTATPTTTTPTYASPNTAFAQVPEMSVSCPSSGRPFLVLATMSLRVASIGSKMSVAMYRNGAAIEGGGGTGSSASIDYTAEHLNYETISWWTIVTPSNFNDQTFALYWSGPDVNINTNLKRRGLTVIEL